MAIIIEIWNIRYKERIMGAYRNKIDADKNK